MEEIKGAIALVGYGLAAIGPGIGIGLVVAAAIERDGPSARSRRHGENHDVPGYRVH